MALFTWNRIYSVGIDSLDEQHKRLFDIANRLHEAYTNNGEKETLSVIFDELIDYAKVHFAEEERLMRKNNYPDYERHKENHDKLFEVVLTYKERFDRDEADLQKQLMNFIQTWLNGHILGMDKKYRPYLQHSNYAKPMAGPQPQEGPTILLEEVFK